MSIDTRYEARQANGGLRYGIIEVTTRCQFRCPGCYMVRRNALNKGGMSLEEAIRVLDLCKQYRGQELETMDILGGEPLLWPHLKDYIEELLRRGIQPWIFTNQVRITSELARWLFERRVHITGKLNIADVHDPAQIRLQAELIGSTEKMARKMIEGIQVLVDAGYQYPLFRVENLLRKKNLHLVPGYIAHCRARGIGMDIELMGTSEPIGPEYFEIAPTPQELADLVRKLECLGGSIPEFADLTEKLLMPHMLGSCCFYDKGLYFTFDGCIRACSNSTVTLARVTDAEPIRKACESPLICNRRALTQERVGKPCRTCERWDRCRGGCRATAEAQGDPFGGYALCPLPLLSKTSG